MVRFLLVWLDKKFSAPVRVTSNSLTGLCLNQRVPDALRTDDSPKPEKPASRENLRSPEKHASLESPRKLPRKPVRDVKLDEAANLASKCITY